MVNKPTPDELKRRYEENREKAVASFPFARIETAGDQALSTWEGLVSASHGAPIVVGEYDALARIAEMVPDMPGFARKSTEEILEVSNRIRHPDDMISQRANDLTKARERLAQFSQPKPDVPLPDFIQAALPGISVNTQSREDLIATMLRESQPEVGEWPVTAPESPGLSVAFDLRSGAHLPRAHIVILPTDDWTTIPAYLRWGNWNGCPAPEYHVAAFRSWRDRYGAEGVGTLNALAAALMEHDWWYFWWD